MINILSMHVWFMCLSGNTESLPGLEFLLNNISIPTDGSGHILVTDINSSDTEALICQSSSVGDGLGDWYLDTEDENAPGDRIYERNNRGWTRKRATIDDYRIVSLKRVSDTAVEGRFTCRIPGDSESPRGLLILYPSECDMKKESFILLLIMHMLEHW